MVLCIQQEHWIDSFNTKEQCTQPSKFLYSSLFFGRGRGGVVLGREVNTKLYGRGFPRNSRRAPYGALAQILGRHFTTYGRPDYDGELYSP